MSRLRPRGDTAIKVIIGAILIVLAGFCAQSPSQGPGTERPLPEDR